MPHGGFWVWKQRGRWACAGGGFCYDLDVPREQGLQRRFLLGDTTELLCSHILSLPRLLDRAERARPLQRQNRKRASATAEGG